MSSIKKNSEFGHPLLQTRIEVEHQDGFVNAARELFNDLIPMATELKTQKREDLDVKSFDDGNKKENNEDVSTARSSLCSCHTGNQYCCGCPNSLELMLETASWKPEKLYVFHCNDCGGTTVREIRYFHIDQRPKCSYSRNPMQHEWQCYHCGFLNSDSSTVLNNGNINLLGADNLDIWSQTAYSVSNTSISTSISDSCKYPALSSSYQFQKCSFSIRSNSVQHSKKCNENFRKCTENDECSCLIIDESHIGSSLRNRSEVEMEKVKWMTTQKPPIVGSARVDTTITSLKTSPIQNNLLSRSISTERSEGLQATGCKTEPKMKLLRTKLTTNSMQNSNFKEVIVDHENMEYNKETERAAPTDPLETAFESKREVVGPSKKILKTMKQISETDWRTTTEKTTTVSVCAARDTAKYNDRYVGVDVVKRSSEKKILGHISDTLDLKGTTHNLSINNNDVFFAKSTFTSTGNLSSPTCHTSKSNLPIAIVPIITAISPRRYLMLQSTTNSSRNTPSSYHYRTSMYAKSNTASKRSQHSSPPYMAPTISSAMKIKQIIKRSEPSLWASCRQYSISGRSHTASSFAPSRNRGSHRSKLRFWHRETLQSPKIYRKKRLVNSNKMGLLTTKCDRTNESNLQNLQRISPQSLSRVACRPPHCGGLYHKYLKPLFWDPITSRNDRMSRKERKERFMKEVGTVDSTINVQNAQIETSLQQTELQLSLKNLQQKETSRLRLDRGYLQQQDQVNNAPAPSLSTTEIKTPRGWQRTFLHVSCKTSRLDRFAPQFVEAVSAQVWITEPLQRTAPLRQTLPPKPSKYNIWQWISSHSSQKTSRFKRFWRPEMNDMKLTSQPSQCILRQEKSANKFSLTESRISRGMIWKRTVSKSLPKVPRLDRFPIPENSISKISQGSFRSQQFGEVSLDFLSTKTPLSNALSSSATLPIRQQRGSYYEQAEPIHLSKVSNKSSLSSLHVTQSGSSKASLTESLSSETLSKKRSNFIIKPVHRVYSSFNRIFYRITKREDIGEISGNSEMQAAAIVKETGSHIASILLHGTNSECMAPSNIVSGYREIHIALQNKFQPMKLCLNGITTSEKICIQRIIVNGSKVYHHK
uniref:Uncharacterized protein n=1 Tax=Wuchereria bancrofti TaxID=6293 RepID=A0AAF5RWS2_WUCBA